VVENRTNIKYNLTPSVSDAAFAKKLNKALEKSGHTLPVHIEVDTGMDAAEPFTVSAKAHPGISTMPIYAGGIFSHLCFE